MVTIMKTLLALSAVFVLCTGAPVEQYPVLKEQPAEVLFRADNRSTVTLECAFEIKAEDVKYKWHKNGAPFNWEAAGHIGQRPGEGSITFFNPQPSDEAIYQCFAETSLGTASTRPISLKRAFITTPTVKAVEHTPVFAKPYKLDCAIPDSYPKPTIVWKTQLRSDPSIIETFLNRRITVAPDANLYFSNVTDEDVSPSFKYICVAQTPAVDGDVVLAEHYIKDLVRDGKQNDGELVPQYVSNDMMAKAGDITMIYCIYGGTPLAYPSWFKDGKNVNGQPGDRVTHYNRTSGKRLLIKDTRLEDEGSYTCEANNAVGKPQKHTMTLKVVSAPQLTKKMEKHVTGKEGEDISIPCQVTGLPEPTVTWTFNGKPLEDAVYKSGVLTVKSSKTSHTGYYGCKATNEHGDLYSETLVRVN